MPYIEFQGDVRGIGPGVLTVGSAPAAGWRIQGRGLEPVHLILSLQTGGGALLIRGSPGATVKVNGVELVPTRTILSFGDCVVAGTAELWYRRLPPGAAAPSAYLRDTRRGRLYQLRDRSTIGRDMSSTVVVQEADVSRLHAEVLQRGEAYLIVPHGVSVTSINGGRLVAPTVLQEGDEIAIGRTLLRFTTALPDRHTLASGVAGAVSAPPAGPGQVPAESRAPTTFMGTIEARERRSRVSRRRMTRAAVIVVGVIAVVAAVVSVVTDHGPSTRVDDQPKPRPARSATRTGRRSRPTPSVRPASVDTSGLEPPPPQAPPPQ
jgi:FHA domain